MSELTDILLRVCYLMNVDIKDVIGTGRKENLVDARHAFCISAFKIKDELSYREIGDVINRDHSSVQHLIKDRPMKLEITQCIKSVIENTYENEISYLANRLSKEPNNKKLQQELKNLL